MPRLGKVCWALLLLHCSDVDSRNPGVSAGSLRGPGDESGVEGMGESGSGVDAQEPTGPEDEGPVAPSGLEGEVDAEPAAAGQAVFDHYWFVRGGPLSSVSAEQGLLANDGAGELELRGEMATVRGGTVALNADGSFVYGPPSSAFWGNDYFSYALASGDVKSEARVRLTVHATSLELSDVEAGQANGFALFGETDLDRTGFSTSSAGDVNGDGLSDLIVGATRADPGGRTDAGAAYVVFGKADESAVELSSVAAGNGGGFALLGAAAADNAGISVSSAGDVNGDGLDDLIVGAHLADPGGRNSAGAAYVVFGKADESAVELSRVAAGNGGGFVLLGSAAADNAGVSVSSAGDVNGDGLDDLIVGAYLADPSGRENAGAAYVVFGKADESAVELSSVAAGNGGGFALLGGASEDGAGNSVSSVGDVNGDGLSDVIVGASNADPGGRTNAGAAYVVFGKADESAVELSSVAAGNGGGFALLGGASEDGAGNSVSSAGDVNGDGLSDVIVGASNADPGGRTDAGAVYVVFGKADESAVELSSVAAGNGAGFALLGAASGDNAGREVSSAGDVNGDGLSDLIVGTWGADPGGRNSAGAAYVVFGKSDESAVELSSVAAGNGGGFALLGAAEDDTLGDSVSSAGDVNGDGFLDLTVGAPISAGAESPPPGKAYVLFGWDMSNQYGARDGALRGGPQDDTLDFDGAPRVAIDGGNGTDTLRLVGADTALDLATRIPRVEHVEVFDLTTKGSQTLRLNEGAVRRLAQHRAGLSSQLIRTLRVLGTAEDRLELDVGAFERMANADGLAVYRVPGSGYALEMSTALVP